jgi:hypothetical protein
MDSSSNYADMLEEGVRRQRKKTKPWQSTDKNVDPGFSRDMGYGAKKKKKVK